MSPIRAKDKVCVLLSGGLDSAVLLKRYLGRGKRVVPVYVRCGLAWEPAELAALRQLLRDVRYMGLPIEPLVVAEIPLAGVYGPRHWSISGRGVPGARSPDEAVYLPGRNLLLLSQATVVAAQRGCGVVAIGVLASSPFSDATPAFFRLMARAASQALGWPLQIEAPLRRSRKAALVREAAGWPLQVTWSCVRPSGAARRQCGRCNKCAERRRAFIEAGVADPTRYAARPSARV